MISETRMQYGSWVARQGKSRCWPRYQRRRRAAKLIEHLHEFSDHPALAFFQVEALEFGVERFQAYFGVPPRSIFSLARRRFCAGVFLDRVPGAAIGPADPLDQHQLALPRTYHAPAKGAQPPIGDAGVH